MQIKAHEVDSYLKDDAKHAIVLIYGPDQGLVNERASLLTTAKLGEDFDPFSLQVFESDQIAADPGILADEIGGFGLFGSERVIKVRLNGNRSIVSAIELSLETIPDGVSLIIEAGDLKPNNAVRKLIEKANNAAALPCYADDTRSLNALIDEEMGKSNIAISSEARGALLGLLGENRQTSRNELKKLALFAHDRMRLELEDVMRLVGDVSTSLTDETIDLILSGETRKGIGNYKRGLALGVTSTQILHALQRHLLQLQLLREQIDRGTPSSQAIDKARPPIYFKRKPSFSIHLKKWSSKKLQRAQLHLLNAVKNTREKALLVDVLTENLLTQLSHVATRSKY